MKKRHIMHTSKLFWERKNNLKITKKKLEDIKVFSELVWIHVGQKTENERGKQNKIKSQIVAISKSGIESLL